MIILPKTENIFQKNQVVLLLFSKIKKLQKYLRFIKSECEFVPWIDISKDISPFGQNILLGCTYIPPEFSKYSSDDYVIDIEEELLLFSQITKNIAVIGDFNARTAILDDYFVIDENLNEILNIVDDVECTMIFQITLYINKTR